jgi:hypothetical protein
MVTRFATSPPTYNCPQPKEAHHCLSLTSNQYNVSTPRLCGWSDGPEVALNWLFPYPILPPARARGATTGPPHHISDAAAFALQVQASSPTSLFPPGSRDSTASVDEARMALGMSAPYGGFTGRPSSGRGGEDVGISRGNLKRRVRQGGVAGTHAHAQA